MSTWWPSRRTGCATGSGCTPDWNPRPGRLATTPRASRSRRLRRRLRRERCRPAARTSRHRRSTRDSRARSHQTRHNHPTSGSRLYFSAVRLLVGDIGGTNARLATIEATAAGMVVVRQQTLSSRKYPSLGGAVLEFGVDAGVAGACFAIAGPVVDGEVRTSNLPWTIHDSELATEIGLPRTHLINDFD